MTIYELQTLIDLMAESDNGDFCPVGNHKGATDNWHEIKEEEFLNGRE